MSEHHPTLSPSSWPAIMACACYQAGGDGTGADATRGSQIHRVVENALVGKITPEDDCDLLDESDIEDCATVAEKIRELCAEHQPKEPIETEVRVEIEDESGEIVTFGTADVRCGWIIGDIKSDFGWTNDYERHVPQIDGYAVAEMRRLGLDRMLCFMASVKTGQITAFWRTRAEAEATMACVVSRRADGLKQPSPCEFCGFCAAIRTCPAVNRALTRAVQPLDTAKLPSTELLNNPGTITDPATMGTVLTFGRTVMKQYLKHLKYVAEAIEDAALALAETGAEIPGYVRVIESGRKTVTDLQSAYERVGLDTREFFAALTLSLPKLAKAYAAARGLSEKAARKEVENLMDDIIDIGYENPILREKYLDAEKNLR